MDAALWQFAGSLVAVVALVLLAWRFGFSGRPQLRDEDEARSFASEVPGGFDATRVSLDRSRSGALLRDAAGRIVLVAPAGAHFVARPLGPETRFSISDGVLIVRDTLTAALELGDEAEDWAERLAARDPASPSWNPRDRLQGPSG